jgi:tyrosine-protein phosphatase non-receptor type 23
MGKRPPSIVATDLTREANKYQEAHAKASESNQTLHKAMTLHITNLKVLSLPLDELKKHIPAVKILDCEYSQHILTYSSVDSHS